MDPDNARQAPARRARAKFAFYGHVAIYVIVTLALVLADTFTSPGRTWAVWVGAAWAIALLAHGLFVLLVAARGPLATPPLDRTGPRTT
jgi:L-asparagine transporter-like permease